MRAEQSFGWTLRRAWPRAVLLAVTCLVTAGPLAAAARAQGIDRSIPSPAYFAAFNDFHDGQYNDARREFRGEASGGIHTAQARWIDSICYETMLGECDYQMGRMSDALEHYTAAVKLFVGYSQWMRLVQFPPAVRPSASVVKVPWGNSTRRARPGQYQGDMLIRLGQIDGNEVVKKGGVLQMANLRPIQVIEIVRCTTLAIRRRARLLGPLSRHDPLTADLAAKLLSRPGIPNHWSEAWIDVELGLALAASGREEQALPYLSRGLVAAGEFDHPLTSTALVELGWLALDRGNAPVALGHFQEATYAAVQYPDAGVLEEAFRGAALAHLMSNRKEVYAQLLPAIQWAKLKGLRQLHASLLLLAAENYAVLGQTREAAGLLEDARQTIGRREMGLGRIGGRLNFLSALTLFQQKKVTEGDTALAAAMGFMQQGSHWLFQIALTDNMYTSGGISGRPHVAMDVYNEVLRDPQPADWAADPMEALAVLVTPHPLPYEHWFELALEARKEHERALEIADRARRHRFFCTLPLGGRVESLRWILEGPVEALDQQAQLQRQDLLTHYPAYAELAKQARAIGADLKTVPLVADSAEQFRKQEQDFGRWAAISVQQEAILRQMAVRREPAGLVFPPLRNTKDIQKSLPKGHALLVFFATSRRLYAFLLNRERYASWQVSSAAQLRKPLVELLQKMGNYQANYALELKDLGDTRWQEPAQQVLDGILTGSQADFTQKFAELTIVPDGLLWYVPFEALQIGVDKELQPLVARCRIRYAPTASLAVATGRGRKPAGNTAVIVGTLFPREDESLGQAAFEQFAAAVPGAVALKSPPPAPSSLYRVLFDRLVVFDDMNLAGQGPYDWSPAPIDRSRAGSTLGDWLRLPWGGPEEIILPGFHTAAENSLKQVPPGPPGNELFLSVCSLMATGARTVLLSRWRTGGQTSVDLVREFSQELPNSAPAEAWQRSVLLTMQSRVNLEAEPRLKPTAGDEPPKASHPFFWAGYMLIDSGAAAANAEEEPEKPAAKDNKPDNGGAKDKQPDGPGAQDKRPDGPDEMEKQPDQPEAKPDVVEPSAAAERKPEEVEKPGKPALRKPAKSKARKPRS